jgi:hypothetical protein
LEREVVDHAHDQPRTPADEASLAQTLNSLISAIVRTCWSASLCLDAGHFALETNGDEIAKLMREFLGKHVAKK